MSNSNMFSQMYLIPKYLYQPLKKTLDLEHSKQIDNINSIAPHDDNKNMTEDSYLNSTEIDNSFSNSHINLNKDVNKIEKSEDEEKISEQKNKTIKKNSWLTCKICGVKKNGQKQMDEHMLSVHSEINKKEKNSTPIKQSDTKNNAKGIENISPIKKKPSEVKSNYLLYN